MYLWKKKLGGVILSPTNGHSNTNLIFPILTNISLLQTAHMIKQERFQKTSYSCSHITLKRYIKKVNTNSRGISFLGRNEKFAMHLLIRSRDKVLCLSWIGSIKATSPLIEQEKGCLGSFFLHCFLFGFCWLNKQKLDRKQCKKNEPK